MRVIFLPLVLFLSPSSTSSSSFFFLPPLSFLSLLFLAVITWPRRKRNPRYSICTGYRRRARAIGSPSV